MKVFEQIEAKLLRDQHMMLANCILNGVDPSWPPSVIDLALKAMVLLGLAPSHCVNAALMLPHRNKSDGFETLARRLADCLVDSYCSTEADKECKVLCGLILMKAGSEDILKPALEKYVSKN